MNKISGGSVLVFITKRLWVQASGCCKVFTFQVVPELWMRNTHEFGAFRHEG